MERYAINGNYNWLGLCIEFEGEISVTKKGKVEGNITEKQGLNPERTIEGTMTSLDDAVQLMFVTKEGKEMDVFYSVKGRNASGFYHGKNYFPNEEIIKKEGMEKIPLYHHGEDVILSLEKIN